jgi:gliding motility-associated-like protein
VTLDAGNAGAAYQWSNGRSTQTITAAATGQYEVTVTTGPGCKDADTVQVTFNPNPVVALGIDRNTCIGDTLTLDTGAGAGQDVTWSTGESGQAIRVTATGPYWASASFNTGCTAADTINVSFTPAGTLDLGLDSAICIGDPTVLDAGHPGAGYSWSTGATSQSITVSDSGTYSVILTVNVNCHFGDTIAFTALPEVAAVLVDTSVCEAELVTLDAGNPGASYLWSTGARGQTIVVTEAGEYSVDVTGQCNSVSASMMLENRDCSCNFDVPNAFTPETSKGYNDEFKVNRRCEGLETFSLKIFNRWGELVFETTDYSVGWDGYYKGDLCVPDVYSWLLTYTAKEGSDTVDGMQKGSVTLFR